MTLPDVIRARFLEVNGDHPMTDAVDGLDDLEPPFAPYDRLRFGGPSSREVWIDDVRARYLLPTPVG